MFAITLLSWFLDATSIVLWIPANASRSILKIGTEASKGALEYTASGVCGSRGSRQG